MKKGLVVYDICTLSDYKNEDILISRFAPYLKAHSHLFKAHRHNFFHLVLFTQGGGYHTIDFQHFPLNVGQIYFMAPGQVHSWSFDGPVDGYVVNFSQSFFQSLLLKPDYLDQFYFLNGSVNDAVIALADKVYATALSLFEKLIEENDVGGNLSADMVRAILLQLFIELSRLVPNKPLKEDSSYNYTLLRNFRKIVESNYSRWRLPKEYAELLYVTPNHLNALCKDLLGISAGDFIRERVVLEAKRLLVSTGSSISEIAFQLNFSDNSNFTKFFRKQTGLTPEDFKKSSNTYSHENR